MSRKRKKSTQPVPNTAPVQQQRGLISGTLIDIVIPIYGEWALAERALRAILPQVEQIIEPVRIIVVDNGSPEFTMTDKTRVTPAEQAQGVRDLLRQGDVFMRLEQNQGFPGGVNAGVGRGRSPLVCLVSADIEFLPGALNAMLMEMDNPDVGMLGIKLIFPPDTPHGPPGMTQHAGHVVTINGQIKHAFIGWHPDNPRVNVRREMASVTGACFMTRRTLWQAIGGMNPIYGVGTYEDVDYCFSIRARGKKVVYTPKAQAYHYVGGSIVQGAGKAGFNLSGNAQVFMGRWGRAMEWDEWKYW